MREIDWTVPEPRNGLAGAWDRFIGPGASGAEVWLQLAGGAIVGLAAALYTIFSPAIALGWVSGALLVLLCLDMGGGIATNATGAAKRWYHRAGQGWRQHMGFIALHGFHIAFAGWISSPDPLVFFALAYGGLLLMAGAIVLVPLHLQRVVAFSLYGLALVVGLLPMAALPGMEWFVPLLFLKLLICHLVVEVPFASGGPK